MEIGQTVAERFLRYVKYDTQSAPDSKTYPSTEKQKELGRQIVEELKGLGLKDASIDEHGYVTATLPSNVQRSVPVIGFIAHMDTSPELTGKDVKPQVHENYAGEDIVLPGDHTQVLRSSENPELSKKIGNGIITSDGTTLLGADDKAGAAVIVDAVHYLVNNPEIQHGTIKVAFTPDEEVGRGVEYFDVRKFGALYAYTMDGETLGDVENETFSADSVRVTFRGISFHPGYAKGRLVNSIKIASTFVDKLPKDRISPETTEKTEGYVHPNVIEGGVESTSVRFIIRDFDDDELKRKEETLRALAEETVRSYPGSNFTFEVKESYRNMKRVLDKHPQVVEKAMQAVRMAGLQPRLERIRGGTDGASLCYKGLPTPNLASGQHNFHSKLEWVSIQDMKKASEIIVNLVKIWATSE
ncbi:MAG TPA: peptidase T [Candidatus Acidoferrales bacterium]|nr:peptidase T [Candidatus Acidoferrales bacterium]